jgi:hypothetical protein
MKDHTILCGLGNLGNAFTSNIMDKSKLVIIERDASNENIVRLKKEGAKVIDANALDITVLENIGIKNARCLLALTGNDFDNMSVLNNAYKLVETTERKTNKIVLACNIDSRNLKAAVIKEWINKNENDDSILKEKLSLFFETACKIQSGDKVAKPDPLLKQKYSELKEELTLYDPSDEKPPLIHEYIRLFNINQLAARYIFVNYPPDRYRPIIAASDKVMEILILGFSPLGEEVFKLCVQNCHYINRLKTKITIICPDGNIVSNRFESKYRNIRNIIDYHIIECNPHHIDYRFMKTNNLTNIDAIYICSIEDRFQASYSSRALELYGKDIYIVRPFYRNTILNVAENKYKTHSFFIFEKITKTDFIIANRYDVKALAFHNRWLKLALAVYVEKVNTSIENGNSIPEPKPTLVSWNFLNEEIRDDNRSAADHLNIKLRSVGQLKNPEFYSHPQDDKINYDFLRNDAIITCLAETEHRRWMATKYLYGWDYGSDRNDILRIHDCLVDYYQLSPDDQKYDLKQVMDMEEFFDKE